MAGSAVLNVAVLVDAAKAASELNNTASKFEGWAKDLGKAVAGAFAVDKIKDFVTGAISAASDLNESMSKSATIFGQNGDAIDKWASGAADSMGISKQAALEAAAGFGNFFTQVGIQGGTAAKMSTQLVQLASDFASFNNIGTDQALDAISGAMRGEYDAIQALVPTINAAAVQHEALAETGKASADQLTAGETAAAAYQLILQGAGAATGDFARTQDGLANSQRIMNSHWEDSQAAIGQAFLPAVTSATNFLSSVLIPALTAVGTAVGTALGWILQLPGPVLAVSAAFAAWQIIGGASTVLANLGAALLIAKSGITSLGATIRTATGSVAGFKSVMSGLAGTIGTGLAFAGIGAIIAAITIQLNRVSDAADKGKTALDGYVQALVESGNKSTDATSAAFKSALLASDAFRELTKDGFSGAEAVDILSGTMENWHSVMDGSLGTVHNLNRDTAELVNGFIDANGQAGGLAQAQIDGAKAMQFSSDATDKNTGALQQNADAQAKVTTAADVMKAAIDDAKRAADSTVGNQLLASVGAAADDAGRAVDILQAKLDQFTGRNRTLEQSQAQFNAAILAVPGAFKVAEGAIGANMDALKRWDVQTLTTTDAGQNIYKALNDVSTGYADVVGNAYAAAKASGDNATAWQAAQAQAQNAHQQFTDLAESMGLSKDEAEALALKLGILNTTDLNPKTFEIIAEDQAARQKVAELEALGVDPKTITFSADTNPALEGFQGTMTYIDTVTGLPKTITVGADAGGVPPVVDATTGAIDAATGTIGVGADTAPAAGAISDVTGQQYATQPVTITLNIAQASQGVSAFLTAVGTYKTMPATLTVNTDPAASAINAFIAIQRKIIVMVDGDTSPLNADLIAMISPRREIIVAISGNPAGINSTLSTIQNSYYQATVHVVADTTAFYQAYNALPTSKSVTINQQVITTPAPGPVPQLARVSTAPTLSRAGVSASPMMTGTSLASGAGSINITVNGAVDPDSTARQIQRILTGRGRRAGGISL